MSSRTRLLGGGKRRAVRVYEGVGLRQLHSSLQNHLINHPLQQSTMSPGEHLPTGNFADDAWGRKGVYATAYGAPVAHPYE
jgi:hypothetical protein